MRALGVGPAAADRVGPYYANLSWPNPNQFAVFWTATEGTPFEGTTFHYVVQYSVANFSFNNAFPDGDFSYYWCVRGVS